MCWALCMPCHALYFQDHVVIWQPVPCSLHWGCVVKLWTASATFQSSVMEWVNIVPKMFSRRMESSVIIRGEECVCLVNVILIVHSVLIYGGMTPFQLMTRAMTLIGLVSLNINQHFSSIYKPSLCRSICCSLVVQPSQPDRKQQSKLTCMRVLACFAWHPKNWNRFSNTLIWQLNQKLLLEF